MTYTDTQLKQALAKMLPEEIFVYGLSHLTFYWAKDYTGTVIDGGARKVLDTELLHLCWLVEEALILPGGGKTAYELGLKKLLKKSCYGRFIEHECYSITHATWQQRVTALAKVKGIEIV